MKYLVLTALIAISTVSAYGEKLVIKGSDTLGAKLVPLLAEDYKAKHPGVIFDISTEGSATGITAISDGTANIGMSSRPAKPGEVSAALAKGVTMTATEVSHDGMAVIVNAASPVTKLTRKQVEQIFAGDTTDWNVVGGPVGKFSIYTRNTSSGTYSDFKEIAMRKRDYTSTAQKLASNDQIVSEVSRNPFGIGYVGLAYTKTPGIKVIAIDGVLPDKESVQSKKYPYARPNFFYTNGTPSGEAKKFIDFVLSAEGQRIVENVGFMPVN